MCLFAYTKGRFPVIEAVDLPVGYTSGVQATKVVNDVYNEFKPKELTDTEVMYLHAHGAGLLHTKGVAVRSMEDFQGLKFRGHGTSAQVIKALGGTPVSLPMPELYQSLQKGIVQGALYPIEVNKGWRMGEVTDFLTMSQRPLHNFYIVAINCSSSILPHIPNLDIVQDFYLLPQSHGDKLYQVVVSYLYAGFY